MRGAYMRGAYQRAFARAALYAMSWDWFVLHVVRTALRLHMLFSFDIGAPPALFLLRLEKYLFYFIAK